MTSKKINPVTEEEMGSWPSEPLVNLQNLLLIKEDQFNL